MGARLISKDLITNLFIKMNFTLPTSSFLFFFRAVCFLLALIFIADIFLLSGSGLFADVGFGKQFKFFTLWSLIANFFVCSVLFLGMIGSPIRIYDSFVAIATMMGIFTVILYWGLFFIDPNLVNYTDQRLNFFREYYLHLLGPLLLIVEGFLFTRAFKNFLNITICAAVINFGYFSWIELIVAQLNNLPRGKITNGLPYPFMNDMILTERLILMTLCFIFGILFIWLFTKIQRIIPLIKITK